MIPQEDVKSNAFLLGLDIKNMTKEQKIQWLCQIIDNETDKPEEEIDFALIDECSAYLRELSDTTEEATQEQKQRILQQIKARHNQTAQKVLRPRWKNPKRIVAIALAAALLLSISIVAVIAKVKGYSSAWDYIVDNIQNVNDMTPGETIETGEITLIKGGESIAYPSIEDLMRTEGYDILYPATLPDGVEITKVSQQIVDEDYVIYSIQFTDVELSMVVLNKATISSDDLQKYESYSTKSIDFYIYQRVDMSYQAIGYSNGYEYQICCNNYSKLTIILDGIGEFKK